MSALSDIDSAIARANSRIVQLKKLRDGLKSKTVLVCEYCKGGHEIRNLTYIQTFWYVRPSGCTDGDYWNPGEGQWDCLGCGRNNRLYDKPEIEAMRSLFKGIHECCCETGGFYVKPSCRECQKVGRTHQGRIM